jgi:hypothetical protein
VRFPGSGVLWRLCFAAVPGVHQFTERTCGRPAPSLLLKRHPLPDCGLRLCRPLFTSIHPLHFRSGPSLEAMCAAYCEALLAMFQLPGTADDLRPLLDASRSDDIPVTFLVNPLLPAPPGGWSEASLRVLARLVEAALDPIAAYFTPARQHEALTASALAGYCAKLAPTLLDIARAAGRAPQLAAALGSCEFGQLALLVGSGGGEQLPPWVSGEHARPLHSPGHVEAAYPAHAMVGLGRRHT